MKSDFRYIGKITIKNLRDAILDLEISEDDIIVLTLMILMKLQKNIGKLIKLV